MARDGTIITETERKYMASREDVDANRRAEAISRVRSRIEKLQKDVEVLSEHHPELLEELREVVCGDVGVESAAQRSQDTDTMEQAAEVIEELKTDENTERPPENEIQGTVDTSLKDTRPTPDPVDDIDLEGGGTVLEARKNALREIVDHLREEGSAEVSILKGIAEQYDIGYQDDVDSFWSTMHRQGVFEELPIESPEQEQDRQIYRYTGEE